MTNWLQLVEQLAPMVLVATPLAPLAPFIAIGIREAEGIKGATGQKKLEHAVAITKAAVTGVNAQAGKTVIDPVVADDALKHGISTVVDVVKIIQARQVVLVPASAPSEVIEPKLYKFAQAIAKAEGFGLAGAIPTRAHNPGDLVMPGWMGETLGTEGISVFASDADGWARLGQQLRLIRDGHSQQYQLSMTIAEMAAKWTRTDQSAWALAVAQALGVSVNATLDTLL